ncbi:MAG: hypothetical protein ACI837_000885, partial [Crocinitomicaceae bacterium]
MKVKRIHLLIVQLENARIPFSNKINEVKGIYNSLKTRAR